MSRLFVLLLSAFLLIGSAFVVRSRPALPSQVAGKGGKQLSQIKLHMFLVPQVAFVAACAGAVFTYGKMDAFS